MDPVFEQMAKPVRLTLILLCSSLLIGCATESARSRLSSGAKGRRIEKVRTTAYTGDEGTGHRNAVGDRLSAGRVRSAASDWSRFPLGTKFQIVGTKEIYEIDDYGGALIGTNTIDLYKATRAAMRAWGVRRVDVEILQWGSAEQSLKVLRPRRHVRIVGRMVAALETKTRRQSALREF